MSEENYTVKWGDLYIEPYRIEQIDAGENLEIVLVRMFNIGWQLINLFPEGPGYKAIFIHRAIVGNLFAPKPSS